MTRVTVRTRNPSVQTANPGATLQGRVDTDGTLAANSDVKIPSQKAVKTYVDSSGTEATFSESITGTGSSQRMSPRRVRQVSRKIFNVEAYGAVHDGVTDDTVAIQAAIQACFDSGGGTVYFPNGTYAISGALQTSISGTNPNCQLYIPSQTLAVTTRCAISLVGESGNHFGSGYSTLSVPQKTTGAILKSTITGSGTAPAIIGGIGSTGNYQNYNYTDIHIENIETRSYTNSGASAPSVGGLNLQYFAKVVVKNCIIGLDVINQSSVTSSGTESFGIIASSINNDGPNYFEGVWISGFKYGFVAGEHTKLNQVYTTACNNGFVFPGLFYTVEGTILTHACINQILVPTSNILGLPVTTSTRVVVDLNLEVEKDNLSKWYDYSTFLVDSGNRLYGFIKVVFVNGDGTGALINDQIYAGVTGGKNVTIIPLGNSVTQNPGIQTGSANNTIFEIGNGVSTSSNDYYPVISQVVNQSGTSHVASIHAVINKAISAVAATEKRLYSWFVQTNGATNTGLMGESVMTAGTLTQVLELTALYRKFLNVIIVDADISPAALSGNTDNYAPTGIATAATLRISASAAYDLTGIAGGSTMVDGRELTLINVGTTHTITLKNDTTSTAANRFLLNADFALAANMACKLVYDGTSSRWRKVY